MKINSTQCVRWVIMVKIAAYRACIHITDCYAVPPAMITQTTVLRLTAILPTDAKTMVRFFLKNCTLTIIGVKNNPNKCWMLSFIMSEIDQCLSRHSCLTTLTVKQQIYIKTVDELLYIRKNTGTNTQNQDEWNL